MSPNSAEETRLRADFDAFLDSGKASCLISNYGFTGEWWEDEVGLLHLRARWSGTGTFLSVDPVESVCQDESNS